MRASNISTDSRRVTKRASGEKGKGVKGGRDEGTGSFRNRSTPHLQSHTTNPVRVQHYTPTDKVEYGTRVVCAPRPTKLYSATPSLRCAVLEWRRHALRLRQRHVHVDCDLRHHIDARRLLRDLAGQTLPRDVRHGSKTGSVWFFLSVLFSQSTRSSVRDAGACERLAHECRASTRRLAR